MTGGTLRMGRNDIRFFSCLATIESVSVVGSLSAVFSFLQHGVGGWQENLLPSPVVHSVRRFLVLARLGGVVRRTRRVPLRTPVGAQRQEGGLTPAEQTTRKRKEVNPK